MTMTLYCYRNGAVIRELTAAETADYLELIQGDSTHTGAIAGDRYGYPGVTVYAI